MVACFDVWLHRATNIHVTSNIIAFTQLRTSEAINHFTQNAVVKLTMHIDRAVIKAS